MSPSPEKKRRVWEVLGYSDIKDIKYIKISKSDIADISDMKDIKDIKDIKVIKRMGGPGPGGRSGAVTLGGGGLRILPPLGLTLSLVTVMQIGQVVLIGSQLVGMFIFSRVVLSHGPPSSGGRFV